VHRVRESCWHEAARNPKAVLAAAAVVNTQIEILFKIKAPKKENRQTALHMLMDSPLAEAHKTTTNNNTLTLGRNNMLLGYYKMYNSKKI
jgi:hypothetical protein